MIGTQRYHGNSSWEQYVAVVLSSLVNKVLQDDQVFAILGGEGGDCLLYTSDAADEEEV